jgi:hypothetical protein
MPLTLFFCRIWFILIHRLTIRIYSCIYIYIYLFIYILYIYQVAPDTDPEGILRPATPPSPATLAPVGGTKS